MQTICNVPESSVVREADLKLMTRTAPEIGVASTKAFTTQLAALALLTLHLVKQQGLDATRYDTLCAQLQRLLRAIDEALQIEPPIIQLAEHFIQRRHTLFLDRGVGNTVCRCILRIDASGEFIAPAVFTVPLQLLTYHVVVLRGTDVDQLRNLAKSIAVE